MKKGLSVRTQFILMWIPFLNFFNLFIWLYNYSRNSYGIGIFVKSWGVMLLHTVPIAFVQILVSKIFRGYPLIVNIVGMIAMYIIPLMLSFGLIRFQKKLQNTDNDPVS